MMIMLLPMMIMMTMICHHNDDNLHFKCATMRHVKTQRQQQQQSRKSRVARRRWSPLETTMASFLSHLNIAAHRIYSPAFCIWHNVVRNLQSPYLAMAQKIGGSACLPACCTPSLPPSCLPVTQQICHTKLVFVTNRVGSDRGGREIDREELGSWLTEELPCLQVTSDWTIILRL